MQRGRVFHCCDDVVKDARVLIIVFRCECLLSHKKKSLVARLVLSSSVDPLGPERVRDISTLRPLAWFSLDALIRQYPCRDTGAHSHCDDHFRTTRFPASGPELTYEPWLTTTCVVSAQSKHIGHSYKSFRVKYRRHGRQYGRTSSSVHSVNVEPSSIWKESV